MPNLNNARLIQAKRQRTAKDDAASEVQNTLASPDVSSEAEQAALQDTTDEEIQGGETHIRIKINLVSAISELLPLPHIAEGRARTLLKNRGSGYVDLEDLRARSGVSLAASQWQEVEQQLAFDLST